MDFRDLFADRIGGRSFGASGIYKMGALKAAKCRAMERFPERSFLDMGIGEPDDMADSRVVEALAQAARRKENRVYADNGGAALKSAIARYMQDLYGVSFNAESEIVHCMGAKSALSYLPLCFVNPGDIVGVTQPGYPILGQHVQFLGGQIFDLALSARNDYLPDLDAIPVDVARRMKLLSLNYPNNPTGAVASRDFFEKAIEWALRYDVILVNDAAYAALTHGDYQPLSLLSVEGAKEVALEIHSMSKAFNMTGWRLGWLCGQSEGIRAFSAIKDYSDSGQFLAIQEAACVALEHPEITHHTAAKYARRMDQIVAILRAKGWRLDLPRAGFFLYTLAPKSVRSEQAVVRFSDASEAATWLLENLGIVCIPWDDGEPALRFSMTFEAPSIDAEGLFYEDLRCRLAPYVFTF